MKQSTIQIHDARRKGGKGYRVKSVAKNGEILQSSEVLESEKAVNKHILAMSVCWDSHCAGSSNYNLPNKENPLEGRVMSDYTKTQVFVKKGWAKAAKK